MSALSELLKDKDKEKEKIDPELIRLVLLLANKALDKGLKPATEDNLKCDEEGALLVRSVNF